MDWTSLSSLALSISRILLHFYSLTHPPPFSLLEGERAGCLTVVTHSTDSIPKIHSNLCKIVRAMYSSPPAHGARIASLVLNTPELYTEWVAELKAMAGKKKRDNE